MQETEVIDTRTAGPSNSGGILGLFTTALGETGKVLAAREQAKNQVINEQFAPAAVNPAATAPATWIPGVSNRNVLLGGAAVVLLVTLLVIGRKSS